jgi:hypothetical protein
MSLSVSGEESDANACGKRDDRDRGGRIAPGLRPSEEIAWCIDPIHTVSGLTAILCMHQQMNQ